MLLRRFYDDRLAQASYLIGCELRKEAIVFDPARDITPYLTAAAQEGLRITHVTETHIHADFVSGTRELVAATGAKMLLSAEGGSDWQYGFAATDGATLLRDGDRIEIGGVRIDVWHTPGHTPEHLSFLVTDAARSNDPVAMVTGDFVFVGDVGRPDLLERAAGVAGTMEQGARDLYRSLGRLASLPDYLQIWPGHGAGSACGKALGSMPTSTLGYERRTNWAFSVATEVEFVERVLAGQPTPPAYFGTMKRMNRAGPALLGAREAPPALTGEDLPRAFAEGIVIDTRPAESYAAGHLAGTLNLPLVKSFTTWAGWLLPYDRDLFLLAADAAAARDAVRALASIGLDRVRGLFAPELIAAAVQAGTVRRIERGRMRDAATLLAAGWTIVDLRDAAEWQAGHLEGAQHHPLGTARASLDGLSRNEPVAVHCQVGTRSAIGASLLEQMGFRQVRDLADGWAALETIPTG